MRTTRIAQWALLGATVFALGLSGCGSDDEDSNGGGGSGGATGGTGGTGATGGTGGTGATGGTGGTGATGGTGGTGATGGTGGAAGAAGTGGTTPLPDAQIRVVHASPTAPAVDIYPAGSDTVLFEGLAYGKATEYAVLPEGTYSLDIRIAGSPAASDPVLTIEDIELEGDKTYTAVAAGNVFSTDAEDSFRVLPLEEGFADAGTAARVRVVHAGYDAPTVDLDVGNDDPSMPEVAGFARFADTGAEGVELPAGEVLQVGIAAGGNTVTAFSTPPLPAGAQAFIIATGLLSKAPREDQGFSLLAVLPSSDTLWLKQNPFVYALHASPDAPAVDIYAGDAELVDNAAFGDLARIQVPPGSYTLEFFAGAAGATPKPAGSPAASADTPALEAGGTYLAVAGGLLGGTGAKAFQLIPIVEGFDDPAADSAVVRVMHGSPDTPAVDIGTVTTEGTLDANPPIKNVAFPDVTDEAGLALPATSLTLGVAVTSTTATVAEFDVTLADGNRLFAIAAGLLTPGTGQPPLQLLVIDASSKSILSPWTIASLAPNP